MTDDRNAAENGCDECKHPMQEHKEGLCANCECASPPGPCTLEVALPDSLA